MTLGFSTKIKKKLTHFPEKIIRSLDISEPKKMTNYDLLAEIQKENEKLNIHEFQELTPKIHTIREDKSNRWKVSNDIHFVINNRTKNRFQFAPILKVYSIQNIKIEWNKPNFSDMQGLQATNHKDRLVYVYVDGLVIYRTKLFDLIKNDGFGNIDDFFDWFKDDFEGKIIHWTDYSY